METLDAIPTTSPGRWWHPIEGDRIQCDLCPRYCHVADGQRGFCFVRKNDGGKMVLTTYGRSSGFCIDPIEKKPLNHFFPGSSVLSFGTAGCNLGCRFCQNWDISKAKEMDRLADQARPEAIARAAVEYGCRLVAFTYNDPVIFAEYAMDVAEACHDAGVKTVAVTAGYITENARGDFFSKMDAANVDLKAFAEDFYRNLCFGQFRPVLETLIYLKRETSVWFEITTLLIPGHNDSDEEIDRLTEWVIDHLGPDVPLHFTSFHPDFKMTQVPVTPLHTLRRARRIAKGHGIHHVYTGNVHDPEGESTTCPTCGTVVIERDRYQLGEYRIRDGRCESCGERIAGVFGDRKENWGRKRVPVWF